MTNPIMTEARARQEAHRWMSKLPRDQFDMLLLLTKASADAARRDGARAASAAIEERDATIARLREALAGLVAVAKRHIYPQPDKPESGWAKLQNAIAALNEGQTP